MRALLEPIRALLSFNRALLSPIYGARLSPRVLLFSDSSCSKGLPKLGRSVGPWCFLVFGRFSLVFGRFVAKVGPKSLPNGPGFKNAT